MKKRIISLTVITALFVTGLIFSLNHKTNNNNISVSFSELSLGEDKLIGKADVIVLGKLIKKKNAKTETIPARKSGSANIVCTYSTYDFKANDIIVGNVPEYIDIIFTGSDKPEDIELNKDYVLFLQKDIIGGNSYHLLSYSEGVFEVEKKNEKQVTNAEDNDTTFVNKNSNVKFNKDSLIKKVMELKK